MRAVLVVIVICIAASEANFRPANEARTPEGEGECSPGYSKYVPSSAYECCVTVKDGTDGTYSIGELGEGAGACPTDGETASTLSSAFKAPPGCFYVQDRVPSVQNRKRRTENPFKLMYNANLDALASFGIQAAGLTSAICKGGESLPPAEGEEGEKESVLPVVEKKPAPAPVQQGSKKAQIRADPHITAMGGGKYDFRGEDKKIFSLWAAATFQVNAMTTSCLFKTKKGHVIDGTFFTRVYLKLGSKVRAEIRAEQPGSFRVYASDDANGTYVNRTQAKTDASYIVVKPNNELVASVDGVEVRVGWKQVYMPLDVNEQPVAQGHPSRWYLDTSFRVLNATMPAIAPHGLIGQSFDGSRYTVHGKRDRHGRSRYFKTAAQGEGAIEGTHKDYIVPAPFATSFKFARFGVKGRVAPRDVNRLTGRKEVRKGYDVAIGSAGGYVEDDASNEAIE